MGSQQFLNSKLATADVSYELPRPRKLSWTFDSTIFALDGSPISPLDCDTPPLLSSSKDKFNSTETPPGFSVSQYSQLEADSSFFQSRLSHPPSGEVPSNSFYAASSHSMRHALQEIETVLMAPDADEPTTSSNPEFTEDQQTQFSKQRSRTWTRVESPVLMQPAYGFDKYLTPSEVRPEKRPREMKETQGADVKDLLIRCAKALHENRMKDFDLLVHEARSIVSITGEPIQRLGAYMVEGLVARRESSGTNIYRALRCREPESKELLSYMRILYEVCPYFKFGYMAANGAIAEALRNEDYIHIIDFQIAQGTQWITLLQALAARPGGPPRVRITAIDDPVSEYTRGDGLQPVGKMLNELSMKHKIPLEFKGLPVYGTHVTREMLDIRPHEALAVNFTLHLHHTPDESVDVNNPRDGLLRLVKSLSPKVTTLVEQESNTNTAPFMTRFLETLDYYSAMFESLDATLPRESKERMNVEQPWESKERINVEQHCLAKDIVNIIACEGKDRVERHELLGKWKSRLSMAGFKPYPLSSYINSVIKTLLGYYSDKYTLVERDGVLLLGWKGRNLISASAWH